MTDIRQLKNVGLRRVLKAADASRKGWIYITGQEAAFRQELGLAAISILTSALFGNSWLAVVAVISAWIVVLIAEILNTAIEVVVDRISLELHPLSGAAKDLGSLAVALSLINAVIWWGYALFF